MASTTPWKDRTAVVGGGTSGFGAHVVRALAKQGARIAIVGRDQQRLMDLCENAKSLGAPSAIGFSIDLNKLNNNSETTPPSVGLAEYQSWVADNDVALLVNAVGRSDRGELDQLSQVDLQSLIDDNLFCTWNLTQLTLASLKRARGTIANVGSLAGIVASPGLGGYSIAKFALTAMTRQLRAELVESGVHVLLASFGPMDRADASTRYDSLVASRGLDENASRPGGGAKLRLLDPQLLADAMLAAAAQRKRELIRPHKVAWLAALMPLWPSFAEQILLRNLNR